MRASEIAFYVLFFIFAYPPYTLRPVKQKKYNLAAKTNPPIPSSAGSPDEPAEDLSNIPIQKGFKHPREHAPPKPFRKPRNGL